jgi:hypothetical protein
MQDPPLGRSGETCVCLASPCIMRRSVTVVGDEYPLSALPAARVLEMNPGCHGSPPAPRLRSSQTPERRFPLRDRSLRSVHQSVASGFGGALFATIVLQPRPVPPDVGRDGAGSTGQRCEQIHHVAVRVEDGGIALTPRRVVGLQRTRMAPPWSAVRTSCRPRRASQARRQARPGQHTRKESSPDACP